MPSDLVTQRPGSTLVACVTGRLESIEMRGILGEAMQRARTTEPAVPVQSVGQDDMSYDLGNLRNRNKDYAWQKNEAKITP